MRLSRPRSVAFGLPIAAPALIAAAATVGLVAPAGLNLAAQEGRPFSSAKPVDIPASPAMQDACGTSSTVLKCNEASTDAIDAARKQEGTGPIKLPANYGSLSYVGQVVAVTNAERTARGLPALGGPRATFDLLARLGAAQGNDPSGPSGTTWVSNLAQGFRTPLEADYQWMYNDGPGGSNGDCTTTDHSGCWSHRDNILSPWPGAMGAAVHASAAGQFVFAELIVRQG